MNRNILHIFLVFTFASSIFSLAAIDLKKSFEGREWEFLYYKLRVIPNNHKLFRNNIKKRLLLLSSSVIITSIATWFSIQPPNPSDIKDRIAFTIFIGLIFGPLGWLFAELGIDEYILKKNQFHALVKFVKKWPKNKEYTPLNFHDLFEQLYALYNLEGETKNFIYQVRRTNCLLYQALWHRFPSGYHTFTTRTTIPNTQQPITFYTPAPIQTYNYPVQNMVVR